MYKNRLGNILTLFIFGITFLSFSTKKAYSSEIIVPFDKYPGEQVIHIDVSDRTLQFTRGDGQAYRYPIAVGKSDQFKRYGTTKVVRKKKFPTWRPTPRMRKENPNLPEEVGPGPSNPLGTRMMYFGWSMIGIHGNNTPTSIGSDASSGCFRMFNKDVVKLFKKVPVGTKVVVQK